MRAAPPSPRNVRRPLGLALAAVAIIGATACGDDDDDDGDDLVGPGSGVARGRSVFGVDDAGTIISFGLGNPTLAVRTIAVTGLQTGERIVGIDFGPRDNRLYAIGSTSRVYVVDTTSGAAIAPSLAPAARPAFTPAIAANAAGVGVDFNPVPNLIRVHASTTQNLRVRPDTGNVAGVDTPLAYAAGDPGATVTPVVAGTAYTNSVGTPVPTTTQLFAIDAGRDALVRLDNPNNGQLATVGALGANINTTEAVGLDIPGAGIGAGTAYATLTTAGATRSRLYTVSLNSGTATVVGDVNHARPLVGIAVAP